MPILNKCLNIINFYDEKIYIYIIYIYYNNNNNKNFKK